VGEETGVVCEEVIFRNGEFPIENVEHLPLDAADIAATENASAHCPVNVL